MTDDRHPDPNKGGKEQYKRHVDGNIRVSGQIEVHPPPDSTKEETPEQKKARSYRFINFVVSVLTLIGVIVYAGLTYWMGYMTRESIDNNVKQFQIDQRPYLWTSEISPQTTIVAGQRMWANIPIIDFGKSPALRTRVAGKIYIGPTAKSDAERWFIMLGDKQFSDPDQSEMVIPPGIPTLFPPPSITKDTKGVIQKTSGKGGFGGIFFTMFSDAVLTQPDVDYILNTEESAVIVIRLQYFDGFGNRYWSNVCMSRFVNGNIPHCTRHNEIH
jgi:hypothetical protein